MHSLSTILLGPEATKHHDFFLSNQHNRKKRRLPVCKRKKIQTQNSPFKEKLNKMKKKEILHWGRVVG